MVIFYKLTRLQGVERLLPIVVLRSPMKPNMNTFHCHYLTLSTATSWQWRRKKVCRSDERERQNTPIPIPAHLKSIPYIPQVWSVQAGQCLHDLREHTHVVETVAFAPESAERLLATVGTGSSLPSAPLTNGFSRTREVAGGAGGEGEVGGEGGAGWRFLASGSRDKTVKLWNATVGQCLMTFVSYRDLVRAEMR